VLATNDVQDIANGAIPLSKTIFNIFWPLNNPAKPHDVRANVAI